MILCCILYVFFFVCRHTNPTNDTSSSEAARQRADVTHSLTRSCTVLGVEQTVCTSPSKRIEVREIRRDAKPRKEGTCYYHSTDSVCVCVCVCRKPHDNNSETARQGRCADSGDDHRPKNKKKCPQKINQRQAYTQSFIHRAFFPSDPLAEQSVAEAMAGRAGEEVEAMP